MATINERIQQLEDEITILKSKINDLSKNTEEKDYPPSTIVGNIIPQSQINPVDFKSGRGSMYGNAPIWNDSELKTPSAKSEPSQPKIGYNKHTHSRYSGGALIKDTLDIVEYDWEGAGITNKHSQLFWQKQPKIKTVKNSAGTKDIEKIGSLDLSFNPDTKTWGTSTYEIDVEKCYLVRRVTDQFNEELTSQGRPIQTLGVIAIDSKGQEMKSPLLYTFGDINSLAGRNTNLNKSDVWWSEDAKCWRFYAVFKPAIEEQ